MQSQEILVNFVLSLYCWVQSGHCSYIWVWGPLVLSCCTNIFNCLWLSRLLSPQNCLYSHHVLWSLAPWIEPSVRLSVCGWVLCLTRRWDLASLEWRWGLCRWLPALCTAQDKYIFRNRQQTAGRHRAFANKLLVTIVTVLKVPAGVVDTTFGFGASSFWWWASFLWRTSECFSRWEWGKQLTAESLMDSAAAKRLDSADTHWPRESSKRTMTTHE